MFVAASVVVRVIVSEDRPQPFFPPPGRRRPKLIAIQPQEHRLDVPEFGLHGWSFQGLAVPVGLYGDPDLVKLRFGDVAERIILGQFLQPFHADISPVVILTGQVTPFHSFPQVGKPSICATMQRQDGSVPWSRWFLFCEGHGCGTFVRHAHRNGHQLVGGGLVGGVEPSGLFGGGRHKTFDLVPCLGLGGVAVKGWEHKWGKVIASDAVGLGGITDVIEPNPKHSSCSVLSDDLVMAEIFSPVDQLTVDDHFADGIAVASFGMRLTEVWQTAVLVILAQARIFEVSCLLMPRIVRALSETAGYRLDTRLVNGSKRAFWKFVQIVALIDLRKLSA